MSNISARIIADSICHTRLTTFVVTFPRYLLAEQNTHKMISKSSASSRAIPIAKRVAQVRESPAGPVWWGKNRTGMQSTETLGDSSAAESIWREASLSAAGYAEELAALEAHKQFGNRVLETFAHHTAILTGTEWANFFNLRCSEHAAPEFDLLATRMLRAYVESEPTSLNPGEWHAPFGDRLPAGTSWEDRLLVSAARCARISYETHEGEFSVEKDLELARRLIASGHWSPFEHQGQAVNYFGITPALDASREGHMDKSWVFADLRRENALHDGRDVWWGNFRWWRQYRKTLPNENRTDFNPQALLADAEQRWAERGMPNV